MTEAVEAQEQALVATEVRTFLIADVRGYTRFTVEHGDEAASRLASRFAEIAREAVGAREGQVIELRGDEALAVFSSSRQALRAATELQERLSQAASDDRSLPFKVGIGLDAGEAVPVEGGFRGTALNLAARLCSLAGPGEVLASDGVIHLARKLDGIEYRERGMVQLKGFDEPVRVMEVLPTRPGEDAQILAGIGEAAREIPIGGYLGSLPSNPLVGRTAELERGLAVVESVLGGKGRLLLLVGEPGAGKTRLAQEVTLNLRNRDFLLAAGRCYEAQQSVPFYPFVEALTDLYRVAPETVTREVPRRWPDLARLLPQLGLPVSDYAGQQDQQRLFWAVTGFLQAIAAESPVAMLLDDLHWADAASLELLQHLARHTDADRVLLLGTYRDVEVNRQHPLEAALRDLQREDLIERIEVRRFDEEDTRGLIASVMGEEDVSDEFARLIHRRTEGNPFFVQQVLRVLVERGDIFRKDGRWDRREIADIDVPESVRSVVGQRLSRLDEDTQEILREASVLGQAFTFDDLEAMTERGERELEAALDSAAVAGMIRDEGHDSYAFDHALTQGSLYLELSSRRRRRLHLAAGEAIESLPEKKRAQRAAELAWHFLEGDDTARGLIWSIKAGDQAEAVFAHSDAEYHYRAALQLAEEEGDQATEMTVREKLGGVLAIATRHEEALEILDPAAEFYRSHDDFESEIRVMAQIGWCLFDMSKADEGIARLSPVMERRAESQIASAGAASAQVALANLYWYSGNRAEALPTAERAVELATAVGDNRLLGLAESRRALMLADSGRLEEALQAYNRSIEFSEASGDLETLARTLNNRSIIYTVAGERERALDDLTRALETARKIGKPLQIVWQLGGLAMHLWEEEADWVRAQPLAEEVLRLERSVRGTRASSYAPQMVWFQFVTGLRETLDELVAMASPHEDVARWCSAQLQLAYWDLIEHRYAEVIERTGGILAEPDLEDQWRHSVETSHAFACVAVGDTGRAEDMATSALARAEKTKQRWIPPFWTPILASVRLAQARQEAADALLDQARSTWPAIPFPFGRALALYFLADALTRRGKLDAARQCYEQALTIYRERHATRVMEPIERAVARLTGPTSSS